MLFVSVRLDVCLKRLTGEWWVCMHAAARRRACLSKHMPACCAVPCVEVARHLCVSSKVGRIVGCAGSACGSDWDKGVGLSV